MSFRRGWRLENDTSIRFYYIGVSLKLPGIQRKQKLFMILLWGKVMYSSRSNL